MEEQQREEKNSTDTSVSLQEPSVINKSSEDQINSDSESSNYTKKQKKIDENSSDIPVSNKPTSIYHQDLSFNKKNTDYCNFSNTNTKPSPSNPIQQLINQAASNTSEFDSDEDEEKKKIAAAKKLLFPNAIATSFSEVSDTLRDERRQEFCPIYKDETSEEIVLRQSKQKPIGSLLAKRIRWDDLKRKREDEEKRIPLRYGPYGPVYSNQQQTYTNPYHGKLQTQSQQQQQSFANPYEQYYTAMQNQYEQVYCYLYKYSLRDFFLNFRWYKWLVYNKNILVFGLNINNN